MGDYQQGPEWWVASDGKRYPPTARPGRSSPPTPPGPKRSSPSLWRRFRRLPPAVQIISWVTASLLLLAAIGAAAGGKKPSRTSGIPAASKAGTVTRPASSAPHAATQPAPTTAQAASTTATPTATARTTSTTANRSSANPAAAPSQPTRPTKGCRSGDPLANVYHPYRLLVKSECMTVTGTVAYIRHEDDGDVHLDLSLPASESHLLDQANYSDEDGQLVTEIVPADQPGCSPGQPPPLPPTAYRSPSYDYGLCTGADVPTPPLGSEVSVTGPYVLDSDHGWMEIHPVWAVTVLSTPSTPPATTQSTPPAGAEPTPPGGGASSAWCKASATPSNDGYPGDYQIYVQSDQPDTEATASDSGDTWSGYTNSSGSADIRLYHTSAGMTITVAVGAASCSTSA